MSALFHGDPSRRPAEPELQKLVACAQRLRASACNVGDHWLDDVIVRRILVSIASLRELLDAFDGTPPPKVKTVADKLGRGYHGLYYTFATLGIDHPDQLKDRNARVIDLLRNNQVHGPLVELLLQTQGDYFLCKERLDADDAEKILVDFEQVYELRSKNGGSGGT